MKTVRDHITQSPAVPDPPSGATHVLCRESVRGWELVALDASPDAESPLLDRPADAGTEEIAGWASFLIGCPVELSSRIEVEGEYAYYVTPAGGGR
jgi:hypothetical protein